MVLKRGGGARKFRKFEKNKDLNLKLSHSISVKFFVQNLVESKKTSSLKFRPYLRPKLGKEQEKKRSSLAFGPISSPNAWKKHTQHTLCVIKPNAQLAKGGGMPQFCSLFYAILQSWRPKGGGMAQWPSPKYAPEQINGLY